MQKSRTRLCQCAAVMALLLLACSSGGTGGGANPPTGPPTGPSPGATGALQLSVQTRGDELDPDGYTLLIDGSERGTIGRSGSLFLADLSEGLHRVELSAIASNCRVTNLKNPSSVTLVSGQRLDLAFFVFCLAPDAGRIFFVRAGVVWSMSAIGGDERMLTAGTRLAVSTDGTRIAFTRGNTEDIWVANPDGTEATNLTNTPNVRETDPALSPDGGRIVYEATLEGAAEKDIFVMNADGSNVVNVTNDPDTSDGDPAWSPDGTQIVFRSARAPTPEGDLYIMNADGSGVTGLFTGDRLAVIPQWSPDGSRIVYAASTGTTFHIFVIGTDGSGKVQLTTGNWRSTEPTWSPDGRWITFASNQTGSFQVHVMRPDRSDNVQLTKTGGDQPNWGGAP